MNQTNDESLEPLYGEKIKGFIKAAYSTTKKFADAASIDQSQMSIYITNRQKPKSVNLRKFYQAGMSIDWLLDDDTEVGLTMFAGNKAGLELKMNYIQRNNLMDEGDYKSLHIQIPESPVMRFYYSWILLNYGKFEDFCKEVKLLPNELIYIFKHDMVEKLEQYLEIGGCNTKFTYKKKQNIWNENERGQKLSEQFAPVLVHELKKFTDDQPNVLAIVTAAVEDYYKNKAKEDSNN